MKQELKAGTSRAGFIQKVENKEAVIAVIGMGYVGLPLAMGFNRIGFPVIGFDINQSLVSDLMAGKSRIAHFPDRLIKEMVDTKRFEATTDITRISEADAILICVPTPLTRHREPDLTYIVATAKSIAPYIRPGQIIVLESTTYPGTTREVVLPLLEEGSGFKGDEDFIVAFSPEREDPANANFNTTTIPKVIGAATREGEEMAAKLYGSLINKVVRVSSPEVAEAVKLTENIFRAVNIALVNELKLIYNDMGINIWEVIDAAATKPFGFMPFYPGPGLGGHCIPIDPFYLTWKAREYNHQTKFIELAGEINRYMPKYVVAKVAEALSNKQKKALNGAKILVVGIAYKKNVDDLRESPSLVLMELLKEQGAAFAYYDPYIPVIPRTREHANFFGMKSVQWTRNTVGSYDAVLIATDHANIDWKLLVESARLIIDTRNTLKEFANDHGEKIVRA
jgi:UDP-N-acetyl-D-glucosamine dehydrogenase